jgi:hypothetical protein
MNEIHRAQKWIYDKLAADADVIAAVEDRIYSDQAPEGAGLPFVLFNLQSGGLDTRGNNTRRLMALPLFQIKIVSEGLSSSDVLAAVDAIDGLFQEAVTEESEDFVFSSRREFPINYIEPKRDSSGFFTHYGGAYRLFIYPEA